ncbi:HK97 family phage prohead protease [Paracoccus sp. SSJ]|uniref:HK97 family phage prohead protease n=1 Tax=Paracoccus sp. SSJ TaxID=3050636 RepID=UPI00254DABD8|nr:HK97 family phage prohead protease [Paracoccus sp. SSJ]MDK8871617.1 HK97 family phage prohead protease [Paracoccus sp. SSJ]
MLWGASLGALELRSEGGATRLRATFPYGAETELAAGRYEVIAARAFADRIERDEDIHLLAGHDFNRPLASRAAGTLQLRDTDTALQIEATIDGQTSWARDFLAAHASGLIRGLSPGFRVHRGGERIERRAGGTLRTITAADLLEVSAVTRPAYSQAQIEAREWQPVGEVAERIVTHHLNRWRL